ncbi:MAG: hypothetical protein MUE40_15845 [Anaerolineae bacterium]|jgi:hypothetical protein|nr:hypothetical protein [Anaerolineae bacterium]
MLSRLAWHLEPQVLYLQMNGGLTEAVLAKNVEQVQSVLRSSSGSVHLIMDALRVTTLPRQTGSLRNVFAPLLQEEHLGWTVVMTRNVMLQSLLNRSINPLTDRWGYVATLAEAADLLRRADKQLWMVPTSVQTQPTLFSL